MASKGKFVQVLSLEMRAFQIAMRQLCFAGRVPLKDALNGEASAQQLARLESAAHRRAEQGLTELPRPARHHLAGRRTPRHSPAPQ